MISFIENHANHCDTCLADPDLQEEISRITEIVLPESKIPKAVRLQQEQAEEEASEEEEEEETVEESEEEEEKEDEEEDLFDLDDEI
jgi:ribosomal protein L12E/L44/L45/RPP1/RPP2